MTGKLNLAKLIADRQRFDNPARRTRKATRNTAGGAVVFVVGNGHESDRLSEIGLNAVNVEAVSDWQEIGKARHVVTVGFDRCSAYDFVCARLPEHTGIIYVDSGAPDVNYFLNNMSKDATDSKRILQDELFKTTGKRIAISGSKPATQKKGTSPAVDRENVNKKRWAMLNRTIDKRYREISMKAMAVFPVLFRHADPTGKVTIAQTQIETITGLTRNTIKAALHELETAGFLSVENRGTVKRCSTTYRLLL